MRHSCVVPASATKLCRWQWEDGNTVTDQAPLLLLYNLSMRRALNLIIIAAALQMRRDMTYVLKEAARAL